MQLDRAAFLTWVTALASACSPSPAPQSPTGTPGPEASTSATAAPTAPTEAPTTAASSAPSTAPTGSVEATTSPDPLAGCDEWAFGPCGEGGHLHDACRSTGSGVEPPKVPAYFACLKASLPATFAKAGAQCEDAARKCGKATAACDALSQKETACRKKVDADCEASPAVATEQTCWKKCLDAGPKPPKLETLQACTKQCGEISSALTKCVQTERKKQCQPIHEKVDQCQADAQGSCKAAVGCAKALSPVCSAAFKALGACRDKAK